MDFPPRGGKGGLVLALLALAFALAMDAFAVSLVRGSAGHSGWVRAIELGGVFGLAQGLMPLIGWLLSGAFGGWFRSVDHWIAFFLLGFLGGRMVWEAFSGDGSSGVGQHGRRFGMLIAAFATSIDAAAAGLTLPLFGIALPIACLVIGVTTAILCTFGYLTAAFVGGKAARASTASKLAELSGGVILVLLGLRILITHLLE